MYKMYFSKVFKKKAYMSNFQDHQIPTMTNHLGLFRETREKENDVVTYNKRKAVITQRYHRLLWVSAFECFSR